MNTVLDALADTSKLIPPLVLVYVAIGFLEYRYEGAMAAFFGRLGAFGSVMGALLGCLPQCAFSVVASALYVQEMTSTGTLLAVYLSTSDEAIPVLLSIPTQRRMVGLLIAVKVAIAIVAGTVVNLVFGGKAAARPPAKARKSERAVREAVQVHDGCCAHSLGEKRSLWKTVLVHPMKHTLKIFVFLFALTVLLDFSIGAVGHDRLMALFLHGAIIQPVAASFIGLIPNCFSSVFLVEMFDKGALSFGSLVAGLCAAAGLGPLVLIKENKKASDTLFVITLLILVSSVAGILIQMAAP